MTKLLTVAVPTYNRAEKLDTQLGWLARNLRGFESECEILISDNASSDRTQEVIERWRPSFAAAGLQVNRNHQNLGAIGNLACCIRAARSQYIWQLGDDDPIEEGTLAYVVNSLRAHPELSVLILNFSSLQVTTGEVNFERCYTLADDKIHTDGRAMFEWCLQENYTGVMFITATVYRTAPAREALDFWPEATDNNDAQAYWIGWCAAQGSVKVSKECYVEYRAGDGYWIRDPQAWFKMQYVYLPNVFDRLIDIGYSRKFCRSMILRLARKNQLIILLRALRRWPFLVLSKLPSYLGLVCRFALELPSL